MEPAIQKGMRTETVAWMLVFGAWLVASVSTLGALFFGETLNGGAVIGGVIVLLGVALVLGVLPFQRKSPTV